MKKAVKIIIPILLLLAIAGILILKNINTKVKLNSNYVNGNTQGNLYNEGTFCEYNGLIYFANPDDQNKLYSMDINGKNLKKLCNDTVSFLNVDEHYIYYIRKNASADSDFFFFSQGNNGLCRLPKKGGESVVLDESPCMYASLSGNYLYYLHYDKSSATDLYRVKIDGTNREKISDIPTLTCGALEQYLYYSGRESDGNLYQLDTSTNQVTTYLECNCYNPTVISPSDIYYLDVNNNNRLVHTGLEAARPSILTKQSIDFYNVYGSYIYYQTYDENGSGLYRIKNDGTDETQIMTGIFSKINITSTSLYFTDSKTGKVYYTSIDNPGLIEEFHPGKK